MSSNKKDLLEKHSFYAIYEKKNAHCDGFAVKILKRDLKDGT